MRNEQVQIAVPVDVQEIRTGTDLVAVGDACRGGHVGERAVTVVAVQHVGAEVVDVQILVAIVVVVPGGHSQPVSRMSHARLDRHIGESALAVIAVERIGGPDVGLRARQRCPTEKIDVGVPVPVIVEQGQPARHGLEDIHSPRTAMRVPEGDTG